MDQDKLIVSLLLYFFLNYILFSIIYSVQSEPFIDEIFHIPQTIKYCKGKFNQWDPKLTTLPGLYFISVGVLMPLSYISGSDVCSVYGLRAINMVVSVVNFYLLFSITKHLHPDSKGNWQMLITGLNLATLPPLYFFSFFYYTDIVSTCLVLLTYLLHLQHKPWLAATAGLMSVLTRQTNIVWVAFFAFETVIEFLKEEAQCQRKEKISFAVQSSLKYLEILSVALVNVLKQGTERVRRLVAAIIGYIIVGLFFISFVIYNGSIVVGDKSAHSATVHFPQLFYYALIATVFSGPHFSTKIKQFVRSVVINWISYILVAFIVTIVIYFNSMAHPYLLADNRHYTFYIWKRLLSKSELKILLVPWYLYGLYCIHDTIRYKNVAFKIVYWCCVTISLVPQQLLEFRYYIIPYLIFRLQMKPGLPWQFVMESFTSIVVNLVTVYLFVTKTFYWPDSSRPQRIIW